MNPIALFFGLVLLAVSVFFVASPFRSPVLTKKTAGRGSAQDSLKPSLEKQRQAVLLALRDLDFDYQAGKVAEEDYQTLRVSLLTEAAQLMQRQERQNEDSIEALIQSRRQAQSAAQPLQQALCHHCQAPLKAGAKFCSKCGNPVKETACPECKQPLQASDRFCPACGTAIPLEKRSNQKTALPAAAPEGD